LWWQVTKSAAPASAPGLVQRFLRGCLRYPCEGRCAHKVTAARRYLAAV